MSVQPEPGDFAVCRMGGAAGRLVAVGEWLCGDRFTQYQHALLCAGGNIIIEAEPGGARAVLMDKARYGGMLWSTGAVPLTGTQRTAICLAARSYIGVGYSWADYMAIAAHRLHIPSPGLRDFIADSTHQICSQLIDTCYADAGVHLFADGRWPGYVTPADLAAVIENAKTPAAA